MIAPSTEQDPQDRWLLFGSFLMVRPGAWMHSLGQFVGSGLASVATGLPPEASVHPRDHPQGREGGLQTGAELRSSREGLKVLLPPMSGKRACGASEGHWQVMGPEA